VARSGSKTVRRADDTRGRVIAATIATLQEQGFAGTSAREIAKAGGFTQGVVFYHFDGMADLLLAALEETSRVRLAQYQAALAGVTTLPELVAVATTVFREDLDAGHVKVLAELIAASSTIPELGPAITAQISPWIAFTESAISRVLGDSPIGQMLPARNVAFGIVALYLGLELLTQLDGDDAPALALFDSADQLAQLFAPMLATSSKGSGDD
jgi:AcrR family transcriptional regulator